MTSYPADQVFSPPNIPPYLENLYKLNPVIGVPSDDELIGIHSVIRAAQKMAEVPGMGDSVLLSRLSEHLFDVQMAKYRSKYLGITFPESTTYTPPTLPIHVSVQLEPVTGTPSEEQVIKVQDATRLYHQFSNVPSMFDPRVNMELSQHLFDIQMARHIQRARNSHATSIPQRATSTNLAGAFETAANLVGEPSASNTNNTGTGTPGPAAQADTDIRDAIERSNRLAEQANQLIERSNQLAERSNQIAQRSNQLVEQSNRPADQSNRIGERFNELFERLNQHLKQSNELVKESTRPVEKLGDVLGNINRVLVRIQHAIVRNHKGNTVRALDCLVNEKGETPAVSRTTQNFLFADFSKAGAHLLPVVIDGIAQDAGIPDWMLGEFLCFYGIGDELRESMSSIELREGREQEARAMLKNYLISCLG